MNYLIVYDNTQLQFDSNDIHRFITQSPYISDWWHHIPNMYIITTTALSAKKMSDSFVSSYPGLRFFISRIDLTEYNGVLKNEAWKWLQSKTNQTFNVKPVPNPKPFNSEDLFRKIAGNKVNNEDLNDNIFLKALRDKARK